MSAPEWFWPPSGATARGIALAPFASGMAVADWTEPVLWPYESGALGAALPVSAGPYGFAGAASDTSGGLWCVTWDGVLSHVSGGASSGAVSATMPSGQIYIGCAYAAGSGFAVAASGNVYASTGTLLAAFPLPGRPIAASGGTILSCMSVSGIGTMNAGNGATGFVALPSGMTVMSCIAAASGFPLAAAGWANAAPLSGCAAGALDPQDALFMLGIGSGSAVLWSSPGIFADAWAQIQTVTGLASLSSVCWRPDGTQALAVSPVSGQVQVLPFTAGVLSAGQILSVSGACSTAIAGDSVHALVAQSGQAQATALTYTGSTWSTTTAVTGLTGIVAVAPYGASGAVAAVSGGIRYLNLSVGAWSLGALVAVPFVPTALTVDTFGQVYVAGSGAVAMASGAFLLASGTWAGAAPTAIAVQQGRIVMAVPGDSLLRVFGLSAPGTLSQQAHTALSLGASVGLALSTTTLFVGGSGATETFGFSGSAYALTPVRSGSVGFWSGSSWSTLGLGVGHLPSAIGLDASGSAWVTTKQNTLWQVSSGAVALSSGIVSQYPGQPQTVPISPSSVLAGASGVFVATSIPGVLVQVA
jgi:hypothetical protein